MKIGSRFIKSTIEASASEETVFPWTRGTRRAAFVAKRKALSETRKSA